MKATFDTVDILKTLEYVGGEAPAHVKTHGWTMTTCPIHGGFSFSINPHLNKWHCFGCDERENHGDGYDLIQLVMGVSVEQARELVAEAGLASGGGNIRGGIRRKPGRGVSRVSRDRGENRRRP